MTERSNDKPALGGDAPSLIAWPAWEQASESQRKEWARSILAALRGSYDKLSPALREATKQALIDVS